MIKKIVLVFFIICKITFLNCIEEETIKNFKRAIKKGKYTEVKSMIEENSDLMLYISKSSIALNTCSASGQLEIARMLLENGAIPNATDNMISPLFWADLAMAKLLVENGADINQISNSMHPALYKFARDGNFEVSKYLFDNGAKMYYPGSGGRVNSIVKEVLGLIESYQRMAIEDIIPIEIKEKIHKENQNRRKFVNYVVDNSTNIEEYDSEKVGIHFSIQLGYNDLTEKMLKHYSYIDSLSMRKILSRVAQYSNFKIVKELVENGVPISYKPDRFPNRYRWRPIPLAAKNGNIEILKYLLMYRNIPPDKDKVDRFFASDEELNYALNLSLINMHTECSILLLENGASIGIIGRTNFNESIYAMNIAIKKGDVQVVNYLIAHNVIVQERHIQMAKDSNQKAIEYILKSRLIEKME